MLSEYGYSYENSSIAGCVYKTCLDQENIIMQVLHQER